MAAPAKQPPQPPPLAAPGQVPPPPAVPPPADREGAPFKAPDEINPNEITPDEKQDEISRMRSVRMKHRMRSRG